MAYVQLFVHCHACGNIFTCNPDLVPSIRVNGEKVPFCRACVDGANPRRVAAGLDPISILPGAYDAAEWP
jgi:hypothetical protein